MNKIDPIPLIVLFVIFSTIIAIGLGLGIFEALHLL